MSELKNIPDGWVETTLGQVTKIESGSTPSTKNDFYWGGDIAWISPKDLSNHNSVFISKGERNITELGLKNSSAKLLPKNTILFSSRAPIGYIAIASNEVTTNQGFKNIICDENFSHFKFFYYLLKFKSDFIERQSSGSTFSEASASLMRSITIFLPPIDEQKSIADILTAFDNKIELLQAQNKTLEEMAQTIFAEWFGKYQISDKLLEGWRVTKVNEFVTSTLGGDYGKEEIEADFDQKTLCLRGTDLPDMKMGTPQKAPIRYLKKSKLEKCKLENGDIVIEISGGTETQSTGRVMYINNTILEYSTLPMTCVNFCRIVRPRDISYSYFLHSLFDYLYQRKVFFNWENGTTGIKNLNLNAFLEGFELIVPNDQNKISEFNKLVKSSFVKIQTNNIQIQTLTKTRDELLSRLMSGEVRVNEFKK